MELNLKASRILRLRVLNAALCSMFKGSSMKTSSFITSSIAALAVVGSVGLVFAQSSTSGSPSTPAPAEANQSAPSTTTTPMATPPAGGMTTPAPATTDSANNNASMNEPVARADRN